MYVRKMGKSAGDITKKRGKSLRVEGLLGFAYSFT